MRFSSFILLSALVVLTSTAPASWQEEIKSQINKIVSNEPLQQLELQDQTQVAWEVGQPENNPETPRPPTLVDSISALRDVIDRIEMEGVNAVANQQALTSAQSSKEAAIQSMLAGPQQAIIARQEQRKLCDKELKALEELADIVNHGVEKDGNLKEMRQQQQTQYSQMTQTLKTLTQKNIDSVNQVMAILKEELDAEKHINGAYHFDPVSLRQQQPEEMIAHALQLSSNLKSLMEAKLQHQDAVLASITEIFGCKECEEGSRMLGGIQGGIHENVEAKKLECSRMAEQHRILDETDREKVLSLKKDLQDLEEAKRVHEEAEKALEEQRKQARHVAEKMVGFYQNVPRN